MSDVLPVEDPANAWWNDYEKRSKFAPTVCDCRAATALDCVLALLTVDELKTPSVLAGVRPCRCNCHDKSE